ncbi:diacylglycerol kinase family protein [Bacillus timonensis]|uniref:Diacylglycerol kinase family protein n=1 Tax=Bacillus timonensis TaxID=1033734 RepID=A0A4S3Q0F6_9BACI|nr:diacylglycerol kinase family protein [Bacillus timonensis]THE15425.1 diacylglycerol kinase family protein [Bacillus timonensis]
MDLNGKSKWIRFIKSFSFALQGLREAFFSERNLQVHLLCSIIVVICGFLFQITRVEWMVILLLIGGMFSIELMNTAVEKVVDLVTSEFHPLAKKAKDIAAGSVLIYAIISVMIGLIIFLPYLKRLI